MRVTDWGEKRIIRELIKPLFNPTNDLDGIGDDCAVLTCNGTTLLSSDRVPHDLIAFVHGYIGYFDLGRYAANLNLSDIAASGGVPIALLLSLALPRDMLISDLREFCAGFLDAASRGGAKVVGGDITDTEKFSVTATAIGETGPWKPIRRATARPGDTIFVTRDIGLSPAALAMAMMKQVAESLTPDERVVLTRQFCLDAMIGAGRIFASSGLVTACMDNTDGIGNCLAELSEASAACFVVDEEAVEVHPLARKVADVLSQDYIDFAFSGGADFSLVGTCVAVPGDGDVSRIVRPIGRVESGSGVELQGYNQRRPLKYRPWNYFRDS